MTIASFAPFKAIGVIVIAGIPFVVLPWLAILTPLGLRIGGDGQAYRDDWVVWFFAATSPVLALLIVSILRKFLFEQGRAVWVDDGKLHYMSVASLFFRSEPLQRISHFTIGLIGSDILKGINIHFKNGTSDDIATHLLEEPREVILARLNKALAANR